MGLLASWLLDYDPECTKYDHVHNFMPGHDERIAARDLVKQEATVGDSYKDILDAERQELDPGELEEAAYFD